MPRHHGSSDASKLQVKTVDRNKSLLILGLSGAGVLVGTIAFALTSSRVREQLWSALKQLSRHNVRGWNEAAQQELTRIQQTIVELRRALDAMQPVKGII